MGRITLNMVELRSQNAWDLSKEDCPSLGLAAHALLQFLEGEGDIEIRTDEDNERYEYLEQKLETETDENEIKEIETEMFDIENKLDVYDMEPIYYEYSDMVRFRVESLSREYLVGDETDTQDSMEEYLKNLLDDIGLEGFSKDFVENYLDESSIEDMVRQTYTDWIYDEPESFVSSELRELSIEQRKEINGLEMKIKLIKNVNEKIEKGEITFKNRKGEDVIESNLEIIDEIEDEINEIVDNPDGDFPEDAIEEAIDDRVQDEMRYPLDYLKNNGIAIYDYVDQDGLIEGIIDSDGYGGLASYDGEVNEEYVRKQLFYIFRVE